ncbi:hypothetical protein CC80DRAFT_542596 [Byssothecium circinans]|uniref:Uncharacterized protein n=1 Tax=Byssothecium circinans TaxID=147558 RepID=A0A6A5UE93_9PLEO|nr:hypothetical protein CC80DRAFT_542596 [Byssothecium circinans]
MAHLRFLDFPLTIRQQIYTELVVSPFSRDAGGSFAYEDTTTGIFYVNRQIHAESTDLFYSKNLFVVIRSNSTENLAEITPKKTPLFLEVRNPSRIAQCSWFAASIEILGIKQLMPVQSTPCHVITAETLPLFASALIGKYHDTNGGGVVQIQTHEMFRYTAPRFSELIFGRLLSADRLPKFSALRIEGAIQPDHRRQLMQRCINSQDHACGYFFFGLRCFRDRVWYRMSMEYKPDSAGIKSEIPEQQIHELPRLMLRMVDIFWVSHDYQIRELDHPCLIQQVSLFNTAVDLYEILVLGYLLAAKRHPERASEAYIEARKAAENGISYLNKDSRIIHSSSVEDADIEYDTSNVDLLQCAKARLSLKAAKVCKKMGDRKAAASYIEDAGIYDVQFNAGEKLLTLEWEDLPELPPESRRPAVLWKVQSTESAAREG